MCPEDIELDIKEEENAKCYYSKFSEKQHSSFDLQELGLLISSSYFWIGASQDGIGKFHCCDPSIVEIKCPFKGKDFDPKIGIQSSRRRFNSPTRQRANAPTRQLANSPTPTVGGKKDENGNFFLDKNHIHYFQVQIGLAISGSKTCTFVTYTSTGILVVTINFNDKFLETVVVIVYKFFSQRIVPSFLMEALPNDNFNTKQLSPSQEDQQIQ